MHVLYCPSGCLFATLDTHLTHMLTPPSPSITASPTEDADEVATGVVFSPTVEPLEELVMVTPSSCWMNWVSPALAITTWDYLTFFPPFVRAHSVATHPLESGWYARRIHFDFPLEQFREQTAWSHVVAAMRTEGRFWDHDLYVSACPGNRYPRWINYSRKSLHRGC